MKERPILFTAPMVKAILGGRKTQTRRICKPQPDYGIDMCHYSSTGFAYTAENGACTCKKAYSPYGYPGDILYVRETWAVNKFFDEFKPSQIGPTTQCHYFAGGEGSFDFDPDQIGKKRVSIHMPRWASRITLEVKGVRVERLQNISEHDVDSEGTPHYAYGELDPMSQEPDREIVRRDEFRRLWESINGEGSWAANPWVWVVEFERIGR